VTDRPPAAAPAAPRRVLVTGAEGLIGGIVRARLGDRYAIRSLTRTPADFPSHVADIADLGAIRPAFAGMDAVVHMAGTPHVSSSWEEVLRSNIVGTRNVLEAAREAGVERVVLASSNHAVGMYEIEAAPAIYADGDPRVIGEDAAVRPDSDYGASKVFAEAMGRMYADRFGMRVVCLRIGSVLPDDDPTGPSVLATAGWMPWLTDDHRRARLRATWLSQRDCAELVRCSLEADVRFAIAYGISDNPRRFWSLEGARALGFVPRDRAPG
jgi:NAD+ dependent glucose-6-phosphate dehydrogenase